MTFVLDGGVEVLGFGVALALLDEDELGAGLELEPEPLEVGFFVGFLV